MTIKLGPSMPARHRCVLEFFWGLVIVALSHAFGSPAAAQYVQYDGTGSTGITVQGTGEVYAVPNAVEIDLRTGATAEIAADSLVKFRDAKRRMREAYDALKLSGLTLDEMGLSLSVGNPEAAMNAMRGMPTTAGVRNEVQVQSTFRLRLTGIDKLESEQVLETVGKLLDVAQDAGGSLGPSPADVNMAYRYGMSPSGSAVRFIVQDLDTLRESAYEKAVADARLRAKRLARLNGVRLGGVLGVREVQVAGDDSNISIQQPWGGVSTRASGAKAPQLISETFGEIPLKVVLSVRFDLEPINSSGGGANQ